MPHCIEGLAIGYHRQVNMKSPPTAKAMERALVRVRNRPQGQVTQRVTLKLLQELIRTHPERSWEVLEACRRHLPFWTIEQQVIVGQELFVQGGRIRTELIKALGPPGAGADRRTLEVLVNKPEGHTGFAEALAWTKGMGAMHERTFVARTLRAALMRAMEGNQSHPELLRTMVRHIPRALLRDMRGVDGPAQDWWSCVVAIRHEEMQMRSGATRIDWALDVLRDEGVEPQRPGQPCAAVRAAFMLEDHEALVALLDRGADWEGLDVPPTMEPTLHQHPAWKRKALAGVADPGPRCATKARKL